MRGCIPGRPDSRNRARLPSGSILAVFVFVFSEETVDAPSIDRSEQTERPSDR